MVISRIGFLEFHDNYNITNLNTSNSDKDIYSLRRLFDMESDLESDDDISSTSSIHDNYTSTDDSSDSDSVPLDNTNIRFNRTYAILLFLLCLLILHHVCLAFVKFPSLTNVIYNVFKLNNTKSGN